MRWMFAFVTAALAFATAVHARSTFISCTIVATEGNLSLTPSDSLEVEILDGSVRRILATTPGRASSITDFAPVHRGASVRNVAAPDIERPGSVRSILNLALLQDGGTVLLFTSIVSSAAPHDAPQTRMTTLRCPG